MAFYPLANLMDLHDGYLRAFKVAGKNLLLLQEDGKTYLIEDRCPHMDAPLNSGKVVDGDIVCRAHGIAFNLSSGMAKGPLANTLACLKRFDIIFDGNKLGVDI